jgi:hypothetical protein
MQARRFRVQVEIGAGGQQAFQRAPVEAGLPERVWPGVPGRRRIAKGVEQGAELYRADALDQIEPDPIFALAQ